MSWEPLGKAYTATRTSVGVTSAGQVLLPANSERLGATIFNNSKDDLFVGLGLATTITSFTIRMLGQTYWKVPFSFTGVVTATKMGGGTNDVQVTELTL